MPTILAPRLDCARLRQCSLTGNLTLMLSFVKKIKGNGTTRHRYFLRGGTSSGYLNYRQYVATEVKDERAIPEKPVLLPLLLVVIHRVWVDQPVESVP
jgi:hypothetical protein